MIELLLSAMRSRLSNLVGTFLAMVIAVAAMYPAVILIKAAAGGPDYAPRYEAAAVVVRSDQPDLAIRPRIDATLTERIETLPGVERAIGDLTFYAQLLDQEGLPIAVSDVATPAGVPWEAAALTPFLLVSGSPPAAPDGIAIDQALADTGGFAVGDRVTVVSSELPATYVVTGIVAPPSGPALERQSTIFFPAEVARRLANAPDTVDAIGVIASPGTDPASLAGQIDTLLTGTPTESLVGQARAKADPTSGAAELEDFVALMAVIASFVGFVSIFVVATTFALAIQQRSREIALQRAIGVTPRQVRLLIAAEALLLSLAGAIVGIAIGSLLVPVIVRLAIDRQLVPDGFRAGFWVWAAPIVVLIAILIAQVAAFGAARRASRIRPSEALREVTIRTRLIGMWRLIVGLACIGVALVIMGLSAQLAMDEAVAGAMGTAMFLMIGIAVLGPLVVIPFITFVGGLLARLTGVIGDLARWNSRTTPQRVASVVSPLMLAIGFATLTFAFTATMQMATVDQTRARTVADAVIVPTNDGLPLALADRVAALPEVAAFNMTLPSVMSDIPQPKNADDIPVITEFDALGVDPGTLGEVLDLSFESGGLDGFDARSIILSDYASQLLHRSTGKTVTLYLEDMTPVTATVTGVFSNELGLADVLVLRSVIEPHTRELLGDAIYVALDDPGNADVFREVVTAWSGEGIQAAALSRDEFIAGTEQSLVQGAWLVRVIIGSAAVLAGLAVANTMTMSTSQRAAEFALLRVVGATRRQVLAMVGAEALLVVAIGAALGVAIGAASMVGVGRALTGNVDALTVPALPVLGIVALGVLLTLGSNLIPARHAVRLDPIRQVTLKE